MSCSGHSLLASGRSVLMRLHVTLLPGNSVMTGLRVMLNSGGSVLAVLHVMRSHWFSHLIIVDSLVGSVHLPVICIHVDLFMRDIIIGPGGRMQSPVYCRVDCSWPPDRVCIKSCSPVIKCRCSSEHGSCRRSDDDAGCGTPTIIWVMPGRPEIRVMSRPVIIISVILGPEKQVAVVPVETPAGKPDAEEYSGCKPDYRGDG